MKHWSKKTALEQSCKRYILADTAKFGNIGSATLTSFGSAMILTGKKPSEGIIFDELYDGLFGLTREFYLTYSLYQLPDSFEVWQFLQKRSLLLILFAVSYKTCA